MTKRLTALLLVCLMVTSAASFQQVGAASRAIIVPDNYPSITAAIANARDGDVIYVRSGFYNETVLEINRTVTIRGEDVRNTIINLTPPLRNFTCPMGHVHWTPSEAVKINVDNVKIAALTITSTGGFTGSGDRIEIVSNIIATGEYGRLTGSNLTISRNTITVDQWRLSGSNLTLAENMINCANNGVESDGSYCNIYGNTIDGTLWLTGSSNTITNNRYEALFLRQGDSNLINRNFGELSMGNPDNPCANNIISGNVMKGPIVWGIWIGSGCRNNLFYDNYIADQCNDSHSSGYDSGVIFCDHKGIASNNTFYHNVFVNNTHQVRFYSNIVVSGNSWSNGTHGNYWDDYTGIDTNGDGVGDTPHIINSENRDNHPLIAPFDEPTINIAPPVYDPPIDELLLPRSSTEAPTQTTTNSPTQSGTSDNPTAQSASTDSLASLLTVPEFATALVVIIASALVLVALVVVRRLEKSKISKVG